MTENEFRTLCEQHDLTYNYSDDFSVVKRGEHSLAHLRAASKLLDRARAITIFNEVVDKKVMPGAREIFYWS